jgi:hypothetical protein
LTASARRKTKPRSSPSMEKGKALSSWPHEETSQASAPGIRRNLAQSHFSRQIRMSGIGVVKRPKEAA